MSIRRRRGISQKGTGRLDPLPGGERDRPRPSPNEAAVRMLDIQMVWDVVAAANEQARGARRRVAEKHGVAPATITEAIKRVEAAFAVRLFSSEPAVDADALSVHGRAFLEYGLTFLKAFQLMRKFVQEAAEP